MKRTIWVLLISFWALSAQGCMLMMPAMHGDDSPMGSHQSHENDEAEEGDE